MNELKSVILQMAQPFFAYDKDLKTLISTVGYYHVTYEFQSEYTLYGLPEYQGTPCLK